MFIIPLLGFGNTLMLSLIVLVFEIPTELTLSTTVILSEPQPFVTTSFTV